MQFPRRAFDLADILHSQTPVRRYHGIAEGSFAVQQPYGISGAGAEDLEKMGCFGTIQFNGIAGGACCKVIVSESWHILDFFQFFFRLL